MADQSAKKEIRRIRTLLEKMAEMAEHVEETGNFESGTRNNVKRYNNIVEHLEDKDILPEDVFPELDEDSDSGQLGTEAKLLADYLADLAEEEDAERGAGSFKKPEGKRADLGMMVALAPFLERNELTNIVLKHFTGQTASVEEEAPTAPGSMDMQTLIGLAPHVDKATLGQMARACLSRQPLTDPKLLVALAPHMDKADFGQLLHEFLPSLFGTAPAPPNPPSAPAPYERSRKFNFNDEDETSAPSSPSSTSSMQRPSGEEKELR